MSGANKTIFFFGAGASKAEGAPTTTELLVKAIKDYPTDQKILTVKKFIQAFFLVKKFEGSENRIPTFEEILTPIDIAILRQEEFSAEWNISVLSEVRDSLIYSICKVLSDSLIGKGTSHKNFVSNLVKIPYEPKNINFSKKIAFISLNYDILLDNQLADLKGSPFDVDLDYCIDFRNYGADWTRPRDNQSILLLKLHGSLNWLFCPVCNTIKITPHQKGVMKIWTDFAVCEGDHCRQRPLIVPPTYQKVYTNSHLTQIWLKAEHTLRAASQIVFVGYSLPESDIHIKYLLKKCLYRDSNYSINPRIIVVDKERKHKKSAEYRRYKRLLGDIEYLTCGFEEFSEKANEIVFQDE